jgi:hypothetical protein
MQGVGCSGGQNPDDCLPFVFSAKEGQKAREETEARLLGLIGKSVAQVRQVLVAQQPAADKTPVTQQLAETVLKQAHHLLEYNRIREAREAALPQPDFEECLEALPEVQLLPEDFDSSGSSKERAERLLRVVLPRAVPQALLDAVAAAAAAAHAAAQLSEGAKGQGKKQKSKKQLEEELKKLIEQKQQAVRKAYSEAWDNQLNVVKESLTRQEEQGLGEVRSAVCCWPCCCCCWVWCQWPCCCCCWGKLLLG